MPAQRARIGCGRERGRLPVTLEEILARLDVFFWGPGTLLLVLGTGVFFLIRLRFLPWRNLGYALACALGRTPGRHPSPAHSRRLPR